jgi:hypothetical protein
MEDQVEKSYAKYTGKTESVANGNTLLYRIIHLRTEKFCAQNKFYKVNDNNTASALVKSWR